MKKWWMVLGWLVAVSPLLAQVASGVDFQALAFDPTGKAVASKKIMLRLSVTDGMEGEVLYRETQATMTNGAGMFSVQVGKGAPDPSVKHPSIRWRSVVPWLEVELDAEGGSNFRLLQTTQLTSVSHALFEKTGCYLAHYPGEVFAGGIVFHVDSTGQHGLVVCDRDLSEGASWGMFPYPDSIIGARGLKIGTGKSNSDKIIRAIKTPGIAAKLCDAYEGGDFTDWYLPSIQELTKLYETLKTQSIGGLSDDRYWSSSETDFNNAWLFDFGAGTQNEYNCKVLARVRAIRAF